MRRLTFRGNDRKSLQVRTILHVIFVQYALECKSYVKYKLQSNSLAHVSSQKGNKIFGKESTSTATLWLSTLHTELLLLILLLLLLLLL